MLTEYQQIPSLEDLLADEREGMLARAEKAVSKSCVSKYLYMHIQAYTNGCSKKHIDYNTIFCDRYFELRDEGMENKEALAKSLYLTTVELFCEYYVNNVGGR